MVSQLTCHTTHYSNIFFSPLQKKKKEEEEQLTSLISKSFNTKPWNTVWEKTRAIWNLQQHIWNA